MATSTRKTPRSFSTRIAGTRKYQRALLVGMLAAGSVLALPAIAGAEGVSGVTRNGLRALKINAGAGEVNRTKVWEYEGMLYVEDAGEPAGSVSITIATSASTPSVGCSHDGARIVCPRANLPGGVEIDSGTEDDVVSLQGDFGVFSKDSAIKLGTGNDAAIGGIGEDTIDGENGNDTIHGRLGTDVVSGDAGDDVITDEGGNNNVLSGGADSDVIVGSNERDVIDGAGGADFLFGGGDEDEISGGLQNDCIAGGDGNDRLHGEDGNDRVFGDAGPDDGTDCAQESQLQSPDPLSTSHQDWLDGGPGADEISGGPGFDEVDYSVAGAQTNGVHVSIDGNDNSFHNLPPGAPYSCASHQADIPQELLYACGDGSWSADSDDTGHLDQVESDVEKVTGTTGPDFIQGSDADNVLIGGKGRDELNGGLGNDIFTNISTAPEDPDGSDLMVGGGDTDTMDYSKRTARVTVTVDDKNANDGGDGENDQVDEIEVVEGGSSGDALTAANAYPTTLKGNDGTDHIDLVQPSGIGQHGDVATCGTGVSEFADEDRVDGTNVDSITDWANCEIHNGISPPSGDSGGDGGGGPEITTTRPIITHPGGGATIAGGTLASIRSSLITVRRNGAAIVNISCPEDDSNGCKGTITLVGGGKSKLAGRKIALGFFDLNPGDNQAVRLDLPTKVLKTLLKAGRVQANVNVSVSIGGGERRIKSKAITLVPKGKAKKRPKSKHGAR